MKKKTIGFFVCVLFIATAIPAVESENNGKLTIAEQNNISQSSASISWNETQKLLASDGAAEDLFGSTISIDGDNLLIGAWFDDDKGNNSGSVYAFTRNEDNWTQQAKLLASDGEEGDAFGYTIVLNGDIALIGACYDDGGKGSVYVFSHAGKLWIQQTKLLASDGVEGDLFGSSISFSDNTAFIGAPNAKENGVVYVFNRIGTTWNQENKLSASDGALDDRFGCSVSLDGFTALIGANRDDDKGTNSGSVYVFIKENDTWSQQTKLIASDGSEGDYFGGAVSLSDGTALIGEPFDDDNGENSGSVYVFTLSGTTWTQKQKLVGSDQTNNFGISISQDGHYAIIGAPLSESAYIFLHSGTTWTEETKLTDSEGTASTNHFGQSVSISGETAGVGSPLDDDNGFFSGSAHIFKSPFASYNLEFEINGGLGVKLKITNNGDVDATDVYWQVHVEGGALKLINKTIDDTVNILVGKTQTVRTGLLIGFGAITITARVIQDEKVAEGKQFVIFTIVS